MTELCYYEDGYRKSIGATIVDIKGRSIILDRTIFYPECGGQPGDRGTFGSVKIIDTQKDDDGTPLHIVEDSAFLSIGDKCMLELDWSHRYKYMKEHSAQHLLSALLFNEKKLGTVAVHQGSDILTIELDANKVSKEDFLYIEDKANEAIREGHRIYQKEMSHKDAENLNMRRSIKVEGDVKVVFIDGIDAVACGGIHVSNTSEIGELVYRGQESIRGHVRSIWSCSNEAVEYRRDNERILQQASRLLSSEFSNIPSEIKRIQKEAYELKHEVSSLKKEIARNELDIHLSGSDGKAIVFSTKIDASAFMDIISDSGKEILILQEGGKKSFLFCGDKEHFQALKELGLKGGGKKDIFSGIYLVDMDELIDKAERILNA